MGDELDEYRTRCSCPANGIPPAECPHSNNEGPAADAEHTVQSDEDAVRASENLAELMRNAGVVELPDGHGWYASAWERHDDPEQQP